jgi:hypothetical protein
VQQQQPNRVCASSRRDEEHEGHEKPAEKRDLREPASVVLSAFSNIMNRMFEISFYRWSKQARLDRQPNRTIAKPHAAADTQTLTPLAAAGLLIIMVGATTITAISLGLAPALLPLIVGLLAATVAVGRSTDGPSIARIIHVANHEEALGRLREQFQ